MSRATDDPVLDADVLAALNEAAADAGAAALQRQAHARIKSRLLRRVAQEQMPLHTTVGPEEGAWRDLGGGLSAKLLHREGAVMSYLMRMAPGSSLPPHRHPIDEECVVLEGAVDIGGRRVAAGGYHLGHRDLLHDAIRSPEGALLFLRGAVPELALNL